MKTHFDSTILHQKLKKLQEKQTYVLDEVCNGDFRLTYCHFPTDPTKDYFEFYGLPKGELFQGKSLFKETSLSVILEKIKDMYPLMNAKDWDTYETLSNHAVEATTMRSISQNAKTIKEEDDAVQAICNFCKKHGL